MPIRHCIVHLIDKKPDGTPAVLHARDSELAESTAIENLLADLNDSYNAKQGKAWGFFHGESGAYPLSGWLKQYLDEEKDFTAFSRVAVDWMKAGQAWNNEKNGYLLVEPGGARLVEKLGDKGAVVLLFNSSELAWRHEAIRRDAGASWDYPEYQPHVTITYAGGDIDLSKVEPYRGKLLFGPEIFQELDEDWSSRLTEA